MRKTTLITLIIMTIFSAKPLDTQSFNELWKQFDKCISDRLPESASKVLDQIESKSVKEKNSVQQLKTVIKRLEIFSMNEEDAAQKSILFIENYLEKLPEPSRAVLNIAAAQLYADYLEGNEYKIGKNQEILSDETDKEMKLWSKNIFLKKIAQHYRFALNEPDLLKSAPVQDYADVFEFTKGTDLDLEPTLYDYVLHKLIDYHYNAMLGEINPKALNTKFWWLPANEFINITLPETDSHTLNYLRYYQDLLSFNIKSQNDKALYFNDLKRLQQNHEALGRKDTDTFYYDALENIKTFSKIDYVKTEAISLQVNVLIEQAELADSAYLMNYAKALKLCDEAIELSPKSNGALACKTLKNSILKKEFNLTVQDAVVPEQAIPAGLSYRNLTNLYYRIYQIESKDLEKFGNLDKEELVKMFLNNYNPLCNNKIDIPFEEDYREHSSLIALPKLNVGVYYLIVSKDSNYSSLKDIQTKLMQVSNLSYTFINNKDGMKLYVLGRESGKPLQGVDVQLYTSNYDYAKKKYIKKVLVNKTSAADGSISVDYSISNGHYFNVILSFKDDYLVTDNHFSLYKSDDNSEFIEKTHFYTDRAIYRPGQTVEFKGVVVRNNNKITELVINKPVEVEFIDANWQVINKIAFTTDEFGSFNGNFVIPNNLMNGDFKIRTKNGFVAFRVEEYKRPTFEVKIDKPADSYKLNENVEIQGSVAAYSGYNLDNVAFKYTVIRKTNFPFRFWWWWDMPVIADEQVAFGEGMTDESGVFKLNFNLTPANGVLAKWQPLFTYEIKVEATSKQGETQYGKHSLSAGYNEIVINTNLPESIEKDNFDDYSVTVSNMSGKPASSKISRKFYKITENKKLQPDFSLGEFDRKLLNDNELNTLFPVFDFYSKRGLDIEKELVYEDEITVNDKENLFPKKLKNFNIGRYIVELQSLDDSLACSSQEFTIFDLSSTKMSYRTTCWSHLDKSTAQPSDVVNFYVGTSFEDTPILIVVKNGDKILYDKCITLSDKVFKLPVKISEEDRGEVSFQAVFVRYNSKNLINSKLSVPYDDYKLDVKLNVERGDLLPGCEETWSVTIKDNDKKGVAAALLAGMYDASLDVFATQQWNFPVLPRIKTASRFYFDDGFDNSRLSYSEDYKYYGKTDVKIPSDESLIPYYQYFTNRRYNVMYCKSAVADESDILCDAAAPSITQRFYAGGDVEEAEITTQESDNQEENKQSDIKTLRENFNETAFFYPNLKTNADGSVTFSFTMPDALTRWNLNMLAYTKDLKVGQFSQSFTTSKPLMIMADMPRFCYEEDTLWMVANVINTGNVDCTPAAKLEVFDATSMKTLDVILSPADIQMNTIPAGRSKSVRWKVAFKKDMSLLAFRFSASADNFSDAEQHLLPILSNEIFMTQTLPITVKSKSQEEIVFNELIVNNKDERNHSLTLNFSTNPVWYAVQSLPYLSNETGNRAETAFYQFYANSLAAHIANNIPNLLNYIKKWQISSPDALMSQLEKDENLKAIMLQETPWVMDAKNESEQKARIANLFDINTMRQKTDEALQLIRDKQKYNGGWCWFEGMPESQLITQYILAGFGKLNKMGVLNSLNDSQKELVNKITENACDFIQEDAVTKYQELDTKKKKDNYHVSSFIVNELYAISLFSDFKASKDFNEAKAFFMKKLSKDWKDFGYETQATAALVLFRNGNDAAAKLIIKSLRECAQKKDDIGMYWTRGTGFYFTPRTSDQAQIMEAFAEIAPAESDLDMMRVWLLTQKRTNKWENTRSTADAIFALLMNGNDWLSDSAEVTLSIGGEKISTNNAEAGTGFIQKIWNSSQINASLSRLNVNNPTSHLVWGGMFRQYFVPIDKVKSSNNLMTVKRELFIERNGEKGSYLVPIKGEDLKVGDKVTVQIVFTNTQDMEFVFLKDLHAAAFEPVEQMSEYQYDDGMNYYKSITDTFTGYYFDYLLKGTHKVTYKMYVTKEGSFSNGYALIQCLYAPEFSAYSDGLRININNF